MNQQPIGDCFAFHFYRFHFKKKNPSHLYIGTPSVPGSGQTQEAKLIEQVVVKSTNLIHWLLISSVYLMPNVRQLQSDHLQRGCFSRGIQLALDTLRQLKPERQVLHAKCIPSPPSVPMNVYIPLGVRRPPRKGTKKNSRTRTQAKSPIAFHP
jgi:hypothetical protein